MLEEMAFILFRGIGSGALIALVALSFNIVHRSSHILNFAQGNLLILAGLFSVLLLPEQSGIILWLSLLVLGTIAMGALLGLQGYITLLPLKYSPERDSWLITTMAASVIISAALLLTQGPYARAAVSPFPALRLFGMRTPAAYAFCIALALAWYGALQWFLTRTRSGLAISALSQDYDAARAAGISVRKLQVVAFGISGLILGSAGFVAAPMLTISADSGFTYVINGFIAAILGGLGNNLGALIGGLVVGVISMFATYDLGGEFESTVIFVLMLLVLMVWPQGLFGHAQARRV